MEAHTTYSGKIHGYAQRVSQSLPLAELSQSRFFQYACNNQPIQGMEEVFLAATYRYQSTNYRIAVILKIEEVDDLYDDFVTQEINTISIIVLSQQALHYHEYTNQTIHLDGTFKPAISTACLTNEQVLNLMPEEIMRLKVSDVYSLTPEIKAALNEKVRNYSRPHLTDQLLRDILANGEIVNETPPTFEGTVCRAFAKQLSSQSKEKLLGSQCAIEPETPERTHGKVDHTIYWLVHRKQIPIY